MNASDSLQLYADAFQQLASISAVLGGLAFTAAAANVAVGAVSHDPSALKRAAKITIANAMIAAVCRAHVVAYGCRCVKLFLIFKSSYLVRFPFNINSFPVINTFGNSLSSGHCT